MAYTRAGLKTQHCRKERQYLAEHGGEDLPRQQARVREKGDEFKASLDYIVRPSLKTNRQTKTNKITKQQKILYPCSFYHFVDFIFL